MPKRISCLAVPLFLCSLAVTAAEHLASDTVRLESAPRELVVDGVVEAVNKATVSAQTAGQVQEILVDVNDFVEKGAPILRIRNVEQRAGLSQAQAEVNEARARLLEAEHGHKRITELAAKNFASRAMLDNSGATLKAAQARLEAAQAALAQAGEHLDYSEIRAPYSGIVLERHVQPGESVQVGAPLLSGFSLERLRVLAELPQRLTESVRREGKARVLLPEGKGGIEAEKLVFFPYAQPDSSVFHVRAYLPPNVEGLYPGMLVKTAFSLGAEHRLSVVESAVVWRGEMSGVYVLDAQDRPALRQVRVGRGLPGGRVEILSGLEENERVALDPAAATRALKTDAKHE